MGILKIRRSTIFIVLLIVGPLFAGVLTFRDYGENIDEAAIYNYGDYSINNYTFNLHPLVVPAFNSNLKFYGPAFIMVADLFSRLLNWITHEALGTTAWHLAYFLSFQVGAIAFYFLARRWLSETAAFSTSLLFLFQPLLWGHAFINPKDIPFMAFFLVSILTGLNMRDNLSPFPVSWRIPRLSEVKEEWRSARSSTRFWFITLLVLLLAILGFRIFGQNLLSTLVSTATDAVFSSKPQSYAIRLLSVVAQNYRELPEGLYISKAIKLLNSLLIFSFLVLCILAFIFLRNLLTRSLDGFSNRSLLQVLRETIRFLGNPSVLLAGIVLGLTTSIRILGPWAGLIIIAISAYHAKSKSIPALLAYIIIAAFITYLSWPYLWPDPINRFRTSLIVMSDFPWDGKVLFNSIYYTPSKLPLSYLPVLFCIQFTEPFIVLFLVGLGRLIFQLSKRNTNSDFSILVILWGLIPIVTLIILRTSLYDNFRQLLFIVPALFLIAGYAIDIILSFFLKPYLFILIAVLVCLPGIYPIIHLHPYQYVYYNSFAGGTGGAYRKYEGDYLGTSFREAIGYLDRVAFQNAKVLVYGPGMPDGVKRFARNDMIIYAVNRSGQTVGADYAIISTRGDREQKKFMDWKVLYTPGRDGNIFAFVKERP